MIIFLDEDRAYLSWVAHHRTGFVLDATRKLSQRHVVLHRSTCALIKQSSRRRTHWTTGRRLKACAIDAAQLSAWTREQVGAEPSACSACRPHQDASEAHEEHAELHLTRLDRDVLSFVLDVAAIHLDEPGSEYTLDVGEIARCLQKTPGQLTAAIERLAAGGMIALDGPLRPNRKRGVPAVIAPTAQALRTLPAFSEMTDAQLAAELARLQAGTA